MATDIAFALAVLAVVGRNLPIALRAFLLTLAVVDDLGAILVIAVFYTEQISFSWLALSVLCCIAYSIAQRQRVRTAWLYVPLVLFTWVFMLNSGVHATVAGVVLGLLTRVRLDPGETQSPADRVAHRIHPLSAGICVPIFALVAAGVDVRTIGVWTAVSSPLVSPLASFAPHGWWHGSPRLLFPHHFVGWIFSPLGSWEELVSP